MISIITVSDSRSSGSASDESGKILKELIQEAGFQVYETTVVPDEKERIKAALLKYSEGPLAVDCVITTGGTGMCPRDVTPEVVRTLVHRDTPGITMGLLSGSINITPMAMASRLTSGIRNNTLIMSFPGSPKACRECFAIIKPVLRHCLNQVKGDLEKVSVDHCCHHQKEQLHLDNVVYDPRQGVAFRPRQSTFKMIEVSDALELIRKEIKNHNVVTEFRDIQEVQYLLGKVLANDVISPVNVPPFPASVKDGYAVVSSDGKGPRKVFSTASTAGDDPITINISSGVCVRVSTGGPVPNGADSVVQVEDTELLEASPTGEEIMIQIKSKPAVGQDIRPSGCDIEKGQCILTAGCILNPPQLGILASIGLKNVEVIKTPLIGLLSTGDEIIEAGSDPCQGKIWDSNKTLLSALLAKNNIQYLDFGIAKDDYKVTYEKLLEALSSEAEIIITTGGVSMGEKDLIKSVIQKEFGAVLHFGRVNMKPGKPTTFMTCDWRGKRKLIFGLPGNPVSTHVTFTLFVLPTIRTLSGIDFNGIDTVDAKIYIPEPFKLDSRVEFARGIFCKIDQVVHLVRGSQRSSRLMSTIGADVLVKLPSCSDEKKFVESGETVSMIHLY